mmetsp:Transcript_10979/g.24575  ORF Transcript_10979/g.24575 Transcript_10979/m.24575 type:complete len:570 (+) Transcript_10979:151-1860(+)
MTTKTKRTHTTAFGDGPANEYLTLAIAKARSRRSEMTHNDRLTEAFNSTTNVGGNDLVARLDLTENGAVQFANSGYAPLDLFFALVRSASPSVVEDLISASWSENAVETIQILMHARDAREGKGERSVVWNALLWLRKNKPITYLRNINAFTELGYFKDLLQIAAAASQDDDEGLSATGQDIFELELYAEYLRADMELMRIESTQRNEEQDKKVALSLAAKYAPSEGRSFDKKHKFARRIAELMFPGDVQAKKQYRMFLAQARSHINIVETKMTNGEWSEIAFGQVPSRAHRTYRNAFKRHDGERYAAYLADVHGGKEKINTVGTQPHELARSYLWCYGARNCAIDDTVEAQWNDMISRLKSSGSMSQSLSVVDVSGSMHGQPMEVAISLGLVTAETNKGPFHGRTITFSSSPKWEIIRGDSLRDKVRNLTNAHWDMSTNLEKVFELILACAVKTKCSQEDMPKTLFIFSDMQFDRACHSPNTDSLYRMMRRKFLVHIYEMPNVVYWNLRASGTGAQFPVTMDEAGTALVSGFSAELLKLFMDGKEMNPMTVMRNAIKPYQAKVEESEV